MKKGMAICLVFMWMVFSAGTVWGFSEGFTNNFFGGGAGYNNTTGYYNSFSGGYAGYRNTEGYENSFVGERAGVSNTTGYQNSFFGTNAGYSNTTGSGNVFLGHRAGYYETGSNKLYISNSDTSYPLIYGEFDSQYLEVNGSLSVVSGGTETFKVDDNGSLLLGNTPSYGSSKIEFGGLSQGNVNTYLDFNSAPTAYPDYAARFIRFAGANGKTDFNHRGLGIFQIRTTEPAPIVFKTGNIETLRLDENGRVGIGTTSPSHLIELSGGAYSDGNTWVNASSRELKENIKEVSAEEAINTLENLKPVAFNYKEGDRDLHVGFIAEDVPELVATSDRKGLESMDIVAVLTKVVQEQQKSIQELLKRDQEQQAMIGQLQTALQFKQDKNADLAQVDYRRVSVK
jgi:hypothetical protein